MLDYSCILRPSLLFMSSHGEFVEQTSGRLLRGSTCLSAGQSDRTGK